LRIDSVDAQPPSMATTSIWMPAISSQVAAAGLQYLDDTATPVALSENADSIFAR
jgi:hypothetical protein